jgi:hypothetical protein
MLLELWIPWKATVKTKSAMAETRKYFDVSDEKEEPVTGCVVLSSEETMKAVESLGSIALIFSDCLDNFCNCD